MWDLLDHRQSSRLIGLTSQLEVSFSLRMSREQTNKQQKKKTQEGKNDLTSKPIGGPFELNVIKIPSCLNFQLYKIQFNNTFLSQKVN